MTSGWCEVNDDFKLAFEESDFTTKFENEINPLPADKKIGFSLGVVTIRIFTLMNVRFDTTEDAELMLDKILTLQKAGDPFKVEWQIHSTGGAGDFFEFDGTTGSMLCLCNEISKLKKKSPGDQTKYLVQRIVFEEASK